MIKSQLTIHLSEQQKQVLGTILTDAGYEVGAFRGEMIIGFNDRGPENLGIFQKVRMKDFSKPFKPLEKTGGCAA